jgi:hypothetical protein
MPPPLPSIDTRMPRRYLFPDASGGIGRVGSARAAETQLTPAGGLVTARVDGYSQLRGSDVIARIRGRSVLETMIGIAALLAGLGVLWVCFAAGVYLFTRTGREGIRIQRMEEERRDQVSPEE